MSGRWIKLHRQLQDCWIWQEKEPFDKRSAWIDLLLSANHEDKKILFNGQLITIERGQYLTSIRKLSAKWGWSINRTYRFMKLLEDDRMLKRESDKDRTLITIENYGDYQDEKYTNGNSDGNTNGNSDGNTNGNSDEYTSETPTETVTEHKQEYKNNRNTLCKAKALELFEKLWNLYPVKKGKGQVSLAAKQRLLKVGHDEMVRAIDRYKADLEKDSDWRKPQNGSTFFNSGYVDYLDENYKEGGDNDGRLGGNRTANAERSELEEMYFRAIGLE